MAGIIEKCNSFVDANPILSWVIGIVLVLIALGLAVFLLVFVSTLINIVLGAIINNVFDKIRDALDSWCEPSGATSNPTGLLASVGAAGLFYHISDILKGNINEFWGTERLGGLPTHQLVAYGILGLSALTGLALYKLRYPLVLLAKAIRLPVSVTSIPFRMLYSITGIFNNGAGSHESGTVYVGGSSSGGYVPRRGPGYVPSSSYGDSSPSSSGSPAYGYGESAYGYSGESSSGSGSDGFAYLGEKYDQARAQSEGGSDGYNHTSGGGSTQYYGDGYRPYNENGDTVESYHLDEGCSPMDGE